MGESEHVAEGFACQYCERKFPLRIKLRMHEKAKHGRIEYYLPRNDACDEHDAATAFDRRDKPMLSQTLGKTMGAQQEEIWPFRPSSSTSTESSSSLSVENGSQEGYSYSDDEIASSCESSASELVTCPRCPEQFTVLKALSEHFTTEHIKRRYSKQYPNTTDDTNVNEGESTHEEVMIESTAAGVTTEHVPAGASVVVPSASPIQRRPGILRKCLKCWRSFSSIQKFRDHMAKHPEKLLYRIHYGPAWLSTVLKQKWQIKSSHGDQRKLLKEVNDENLQNPAEEACQTGSENNEESTAEKICLAKPRDHQESCVGTSTDELSSESGSHSNSTATVEEADKGYQECSPSLDYKCEYCCRQFARREKLKAHLKLEHKVTEFQGCKRTPNRNIAKGLEEESPTTKESKNLHQSPHWNQNHPQVFESPVTDAQKYLSVPDELNSADKVDEEAGKNGASRVNSKLDHGNSESKRNLNKNLQCILCRYKSPQASRLMRHLARHHKMNKRTALQSVEKAKLSRVPVSASLRIRERRTEICPFCSDEYDAAYLPNHIRKHTGEKLFSCHLCPEKFNRRSSLTEHLRKPHTNAETIKEEGSADKQDMNKNSEDDIPSSHNTNQASIAPAAPSLFPNQDVNHSDIPLKLTVVKTSDDEPYNSQIASQSQIKLEHPAEETTVVWYCTECWMLFDDLPTLKEHICVSHGSWLLSSIPHDDETDFHHRLEKQDSPETQSRSPCSSVSGDSCQAPPNSPSHSPLELKELSADGPGGPSVRKFEVNDGSVLNGDDMCVYLCELCDEDFTGLRNIVHHLKADHCMSQSYIDDFIRGIDNVLM